VSVSFSPANFDCGSVFVVDEWQSAAQDPSCRDAAPFARKQSFAASFETPAAAQDVAKEVLGNAVRVERRAYTSNGGEHQGAGIR
jgi:hypothetical protein